jgi:hypothetical protein
MFRVVKALFQNIVKIESVFILPVPFSVSKGIQAGDGLCPRYYILRAFIAF